MLIVFGGVSGTGRTTLSRAVARRRVESRESDVPGLAPPPRQAVVSRVDGPGPEPHHVVDTAHRTVPDTLADIERMIAAGCAAMSPQAGGASFAFPAKPA